MNSFSPTAHGLGVVFRRPLIALAEIVWRWTFAATALTLTWFFFREYLGSLPVTLIDRLLLASNQPVLIFQALHRIFSGSAFRFTEAGVLLAIGLAIAWVALASFGRAVTVNAALADLNLESTPGGIRLRSIFFLNFLRAAVLLAALCGASGAAIFASSFWASTHVDAAAAFRAFSLILFAAGGAWAVLNWFLSLAPVFVVSENASAMSSIGSAVRQLQQRTGPMLLTGFLFGLIHLGILVAAFLAVFSAFGALAQASPPLAWLFVFIAVAAYCAAADFLYTARLAAYAFIGYGADPEPLPSFADPAGPANVDRSELILSDVPLAAT